MAWGLVAALAAACGGSDHDGARSSGVSIDTVRGVEHVVSAGPGSWPEDEGWRVDPDRGIAIGETDGDGPYVFGRVAGVAVDEAGRVYVGDTQALEVRVFSPDGEFVARFGRQGEGPGEFSSINGLSLAPEGVAVMDGRQGRVTVFRPDGEVVRSFRLKRSYMVIEFGGLMRFDHRGRFYDRARLSSAIMIDSIGVVVYDSSGGHVDTTLVDSIHRDFIMIERGGRPYMSFPRPFAPRPSVAVGPRGRIYFARGDPYRVTVLSPVGDTVRVIRRPVTPRRVTGAERDSALESVRKRFRDVGREAPGTVELPGTKAVIMDLEVDGRGNLWVRGQPEYDASSVPWSVHDPEGRYLGSVELPRMWVMQIGEDFVAGVRTDELGVQRVVVHPIQRSTASP